MDFPYTGLDRLGVPAYSTALWPEDGAFCNGLGAGPSLEHALSHGLLELIQRDGNSVNYRALDQGMAVDIETSDPETRNLLAHLDREGVEVIVKLAATDFGMANLYVVGYDRDPGDAPHPLALSACGEAAHPDREIALRKSLLEYVAASARKLFNHGPLRMVEPVTPLATSSASARARSAARKTARSRRCSNGSPPLPKRCTT